MFTSLLSASVPYLAVGMGLLVFHNAWIAILAYHAGMAAVVFLSKPVVPFKYVIRRGTSNYLLFSVVIGASGGVLLYMLWPVLSVPPDIDIYMRNVGLTAATWPYFVAYYILVNPSLEEYYWRGCLGSNVKRPVLNDLLFAGYHLIVLAGNVGAPWLVVVFLVLCAAAWYWRQLRRLTNGLMATTLSHMAADVTVILAIYFLTARA
jgi:hypothetical protein